MKIVFKRVMKFSVAEKNVAVEYQIADRHASFTALEEGVDCLAQYLKFHHVKKGSKVLLRITKVEAQGSNKIHAKIV